MKLSDLFSGKGGKICHKKARLKVDISLNNGECRKAGDEVSVLIDNMDGTYHVEDNEFSTTVNENEIDIYE